MNFSLKRSGAILIAGYSLVLLVLPSTVYGERVSLRRVGDVYDYMTPSGGVLNTFMNNSWSQEGEYFFHYRPIVSPITSLNPGTTYQWDSYPGPSIGTGGYMRLPTNAYVNLPSLNTIARPEVYNGVSYYDNINLWTYEMVTAGLIVPVMEYTVTLPDLPEGMIYTDWMADPSPGAYSRVVSGMVVYSETHLYYKADGSIFTIGVDTWEPGESLRIQPILLLASGNTPSGYMAFSVVTAADIIAVPEPHLTLLGLSCLAFWFARNKVFGRVA